MRGIAPCFSFGSGPSVLVPGLAGKLKLAAATAVLVAVLPAPTGAVTWTANMPASPAFLGLELYTQPPIPAPDHRMSRMPLDLFVSVSTAAR
jgi:hypothetical protein